MGLDTSHDAWHGGYISFGQFRKEIAASIGITLDNMQGFHGTISWDGVQDDLKYLLNHSDCDGYLKPGQCKKIAKRLREVEPLLPNEWVRQKAIQFAKGCELAHKQKKKLEFH